eukprot:m.120744 g.120744  ORF g.120744 m.120744 type:complete len:76 (-) comp9280_c0_seq2:3135-3362(-)
MSDAAGPAATDPEITMIVVTPETMSGGDYVNRVRAAAGLCALEVVCIPYVHSELAAGKLSSTYMRSLLAAQNEKL